MKSIGKILVKLMFVAVFAMCLTVFVSVAASAAYYVGAEYDVYEDSRSNDYGNTPIEYYHFSDESAILVNGKPLSEWQHCFDKDEQRYEMDFDFTITFTKTGSYSILRKSVLYSPEYGAATGYKRVFNSTLSYNDVVMPTYISNPTISVQSDPFVGGGVFPEFSIVDNEYCYVDEVTFYSEMVDYYPGDTLPHYSAGTVIKYVRLTLKPKVGYFFAWAGSEDGSWTVSPYEIKYNGKSVGYATGNHSFINNEIYVYFDVTLAEGAVYSFYVNNLDKVVHAKPVDTTATDNHSAVTITKVEHVMFNKVLTYFEKGDQIATKVYAKTEGKNKFATDAFAIWNGVRSDTTEFISDTERVFCFIYTVDALPEQYINHVSVDLPSYAVGDTPAANAISNTEGVQIKEVQFLESFDKFEAGKEYTAKIILSKDEEYVYADVVTAEVNGKTAELLIETTGSGKFTTKVYSIVAKVTPASIEKVMVSCVGNINYVVNGQTVTVSHGTTCKVGYLSDGKYVSVTSKENGNGTYSFQVPNGVQEVILASQGDTTLVNHKGSWYYIKAGEVDFSFTGLHKYNGAWYYIKGGVLSYSSTTLVKYNGEWFYVVNGKVASSTTALVDLNGEDWYVVKGKIAGNTTGLVKVDGIWYYVVKGKVAGNTTSLVKYNGEWFYVVKGKVASSTTAMIKYNGEDWYVVKGKIAANTTGLVKYNGIWYYVVKGKLAGNTTSLVKYNNEWFYVVKGRVDSQTTGIVVYNGGWYYLVKGKIAAKTTTLVQYGGSWYYVKEGSVDWSYTGNFVFNGKTYKIQKGRVV